MRRIHFDSASNFHVLLSQDSVTTLHQPLSNVLTSKPQFPGEDFRYPLYTAIHTRYLTSPLKKDPFLITAIMFCSIHILSTYHHNIYGYMLKLFLLYF